MNVIDPAAVAALRGKPITLATQHELIEDMDGQPIGMVAIEWSGIFTGIGGPDVRR
ncbi:hypothetical protein [Streptomyces sp. 5-10]|uniref:hypothetical protein n=1 Tax=Streptomyces sp. 5-10 TaxID=878925 RepID=UPI00168B9381|nr:hypothetical protein [Streptomyces sp. 5-10]MBD3010303.1 hypothetical protein [Streptomyces sp. 5-10]